ncbi:MAG TPA: ATP-binding cassette domain-containing protein, partial [Solirubrobacterales bacterium]|nr:ATP-binding cassette domain-containing protein [Solirubrobacterales bacterium]
MESLTPDASEYRLAIDPTGSRQPAGPPPIRRIPLEDPEPATEVLPPVGDAGHAPQGSGFTAARRSIKAPQFSIRRMEIDDVSVHYGAKAAVKNVSLPVRQGEVLALIGPSGCGKTTLLRSLNRLTELTTSARLSGRILLDDLDITQIEPTLLRRRVTMVFQQP